MAPFTGLEMLSSKTVASNASKHKHCQTCTCLSTETSSDNILNSVDAVDRAMARLQDEIENKIAALAQLRQTRNQCVPAGRLLPELLSEIFIYYLDACTTPSSQHIVKTAWLPVIHTCAHWRAVAFTGSRICNAPDLRFPRLVCLLSAHFGGGPLRVVLSRTRDADDPDTLSNRPMLDIKSFAIPTLLSKGNPITVLDLCGSADHLQQCITGLLPHAAKDLHTLRVDADLPDDGDTDAPLIDLSYFASFGTVDYLPKLRVLYLDAVDFDWADMLRSCAATLQELTLRHCTLSPHIETLADLRCLEKLVITQSEDFSPPREGATVVLPALVHLDLREHEGTCVALLQRFELPARCCITIKISSLWGADPMLLEELTRQISGPPLHTVRVVIRDIEAKLQYEVDADVRRSLKFSTLGPTIPGRVLHMFGHALASKPLALEITMESDDGISAQELAVLTADSVCSLSIHGSGDFLGALAECLAAHNTFLPRLERLAVRDADFARLEEKAAQHWIEGLVARREVLKIVDTEGCKAVPLSPV